MSESSQSAQVETIWARSPCRAGEASERARVLVAPGSLKGSRFK